MSRKTFLTIVSLVAVCVGAFALFAPAMLLNSKGVAPSEAGNLWAREVGVVILSIGVTTFLLKGEGDSPALQAFLVGNAILQIGLFPIEIIAYAKGVVTKISGIAPNSVLHLVLASGFVYFATRIKKRAGRFSSATTGPPTE